MFKPVLSHRSSYNYEIPDELIAQTPVAERDSSRLLSLDKSSGQLSHLRFYDIIDLLNPGDCLVLNDTKVIPCRIFGKNQSHAGKIETVLIKRLDGIDETWECLTRPGKKTRLGDVIIYEQSLIGEVVDITDGGVRVIKFTHDGSFFEKLDSIGIMPLPPYITKKLEDNNRYQTVYAKYDGSAAAPTAGLHFTPDLLEKIEKKGVRIAKLCLHVGIGTFRPVKENDVTKHHMHSEKYKITTENADLINECRQNGGKIIAVGTTSCRTLETVSDESGYITAGEGETDIFIYPPYNFRAVDGLITNFHLPESTLLMLVCALGGYKNVMSAYSVAVVEKYKFFSFGDAMFII